MTPRKSKVLLAEDDQGVSAIICALLQANDFDVRIAESGLEALRLARRWMPDAVVLDINLPEMSGLDVCRELKSDPKSSATPVVFCSGEGQWAAEALAMGGAVFLEKPGGVLKLAECLKDLLSYKPRIDIRLRDHLRQQE